MSGRARLSGLLVAFAVAAMAHGPAHAQTGDAVWGARAPTSCPVLREATPPTALQAAQLVRCKHESASTSSGELVLMERLTVQVGGAMPFVALYNTFTMPDADTTKRVHPLRGSWTWSRCLSRRDAAIYGSAELNCREAVVPSGTGVCWRTTFGDWRCLLTGPAQAAGPLTRAPR